MQRFRAEKRVFRGGKKLFGGYDVNSLEETIFDDRKTRKVAVTYKNLGNYKEGGHLCKDAIYNEKKKW